MGGGIFAILWISNEQERTHDHTRRFTQVSGSMEKGESQEQKASVHRLYV